MKGMEIDETLSKLKKELEVKNDIELTESLGISPEILLAWKKERDVDCKLLVNACLSNGIKLDKIFGNGQEKDIIRAAIEIFIEKGCAETSIDFFAQKTGLSKKAVHGYYGGQN